VLRTTPDMGRLLSEEKYEVVEDLLEDSYWWRLPHLSLTACFFLPVALGFRPVGTFRTATGSERSQDLLKSGSRRS
jgi:hypothetical protein